MTAITRVETVQQTSVAEYIDQNITGHLGTDMMPYLKRLRDNPDDQEARKQLRVRALQRKKANTIDLGDWSVDRGLNEISETLGVCSLSQVEEIFLEFLDTYSTEESIISMNFGPGSGVTLYENVPERVERIGYGDKIYFSLFNYLKNFLTPQLINENGEIPKGFQKFLQVLCTLILQELRKKSQNKGTRTTWLESIVHQPQNIRTILQNLNKDPAFLETLKDALKERAIRRDDEFTAEIHTPLQPEEITLLNEYLRNPSDFLHHYFSSEFIHSHDNTALAAKAPIFPEKIILGDFKDINQLPFEFHVGESFRADSHGTNEEFAQFIKDTASKLRPGGYFRSDGSRESYTRQERLDELVALKQSNPHCQVHMIINTKGIITAYFIEKKNPQGKYFTDFLEENPEKKQVFFREGSKLMDIEDFIAQSPIQVLKSTIIGEIKKVLSHSFSTHHEVRQQFKGKNNYFIPRLVQEIMDEMKFHIPIDGFTTINEEKKRFTPDNKALSEKEITEQEAAVHQIRTQFHMQLNQYMEVSENESSVEKIIQTSSTTREILSKIIQTAWFQEALQEPVNDIADFMRKSH